MFVPENLENFKKDVTLRNRVTKKEYELPEDGAAVCEKTASLLGLKPGDELTLEKDDKEYHVKISVITENYAAIMFIYTADLQRNIWRRAGL